MARDAEEAMACDVAPAFDVATEIIVIGPCELHWRRAQDLQLGTLRALQQEIQNRFRVPVTLEELRHADDCNLSLETSKKICSSTLEAVSRCVAAFQKASDATEHTAPKLQ